MKNKLIYFLLFISLPVFAQNAKDGERYFNQGLYQEAKEIYTVLLKKKPKDKLLNYRMGRCCFELKEVEDAIKYFQTAGENYYSSGYYLGELYTHNYEFEKAVKAYKSYLKVLKPENEQIPAIERKITECELAERLLARVEDIAIVDSLIVDKKDFLNHYSFSSELGGLKYEMLILDSVTTQDKIIYKTQRNDRIYFSDSINGKMNLFTYFRLLDKWSEPIALPEIVNFSGSNNNYPFLLLDGVTLYFGSDNENSIGGYDIFITKYSASNDNYLVPENIGMPFNSPYNDYMMVIDEVNNTGWFTTDRYQEEGKVCIYMFVPNEIKNIVRSDDKNFIRRSARLEIYRQADPVESKVVKKENTDEAGTGKEFELAIHDKLTYTSKSQFKSKVALSKFEVLTAEVKSNEDRKSQLNNLREKYAAATNDQQTALTNQIIILESSIRESEQKISNLRIEVCNEEIKYLFEN